MPLPLLFSLVASVGYASRGALLPSCTGSLASAATRCSALAMMAEDGSDEENTLKCDVRKLPRSAVALDIKVPAKMANDIHMKTLAKMAKSTKLPGFRDGKAPPQAVIAKIGLQRVKEATVEQIVDIGMSQSGVGQRIQTVGEARLPEELETLAKRYVVGDPLSFTVEVDVYPNCEVDEAQYKGLQVDVEKVEFNQEAYDASLNKLRRQFADLVAANAPAEEGMQVIVDMNGYLANADGSKGEELPAVAGGDDLPVPLEPGKFMPGLVEGLIGANAGDVREVRVTFPARSSIPQLAGKEAIFVVDCKEVQRRVLPEVPSDAFADKVKPGMTYEELDEKLREGVQADCDERLKANTHKALEKALVGTLPEEFEVPSTLVETHTKERFAAMLSDMRENGTPDDELKKLITQENYDQFEKISRPMATSKIKAEFALKAVAMQQGLAVPADRVDDEMMTLQAQAVQKGEKFKPSEVRPRVQAQLEKTLVLDFLQQHASVSLVEPREVDPSELLGATPEELAAEIQAERRAKAAKEQEAPPAEKAQAKMAAEAEAKAATEPKADEEEAKAQVGSPPTGFEWGDTF